MLIQTFEHGYQVISHVLTNDMGIIYICRDVPGGQEYTVLRLKNKAIIPELMIYLTANIKKDVFTDYIEHFVFEDDFYVVLKYYQGISLAEKLKNEHCSLQERLKLGAKILERMVLFNMPAYFQANCLMAERIIVKPSLDIEFNYLPSDIRDFATANEKTVLKSVIIVFKELFAEELWKRSAPPINLFYADLQNKEHFDNIGLYKLYIQMCRKVESIPMEEVQKPKSKLFLLWEQVTKRFGLFEKILTAVLLILAFVYFFGTVYDAVHPTLKQEKHFDYIGNVKILENQKSGGR